MEKSPVPALLPPFPVFQSLFNGLRLVFAHARLFSILSFFPYMVTLASLVALRLLGGKLGMVWLPIILLPAGFVMGLQSALILRFVVLQEYPLLDDGPDKITRNRAVTSSAVAYGVITFFKVSLYVVLFKLYLLLNVANQDEAMKYAMPALGLMILMVWAARWLWLHVPMALDWQLKGFYQRIGGWSGSLRIFALYMMASLILDFIAGFFRQMIAAVAQGEITGFAAAFDDAVVAASIVIGAVLFNAATASAVKSLVRGSLKDMRA